MGQEQAQTSRLDRFYLAMMVIVLVAFGLRLLNLDAFSFWTDEGLTPLRASYPIGQILQNDVIIQGVVTKDTHPPLFYLIVHFLRLGLGETDFAYRYSSVIASLLLVPLMYQFGRRLYGHRLYGRATTNAHYLGLLAAALTAINPLQIWYANESRMYTLTVLLMAGASYVLWRALTGADLRRSLFWYLLLAGAGLYTHYTAVFLIATQSLFWLWLLWHAGQKKLIIAIGLIGILAAIPLIPVTVPRLFTGAEANYFYVSPRIMLQDVVHFFGLGLTVDFKETAVKLLDVLALALLLLGFYAAGTWKGRAFLFVYLLSVVFGLMVGSLLKPMYQGVRHSMVGSPAFILLVSWAVVYAWEQVRRKSAVSQLLWATIGTVGLLTVFIGPLVALNNFYNHPEIYAKDDFQGLIAHMEAQAGENDVIVYNNAIHLPLHEHYRTRTDVAVTAVPIYPTLAAETAEQELLRLAQTYDRIWFVTDPPADHRDDDGLVLKWLMENSTQIAQHRAHARTTIVESLGFATTPTQVDHLPEDGTTLAVQWPTLPPLSAVRLEATQPITRTAVWLTTFWESSPPPPSQTDLRFSLRDVNGEEWAADIQPLLPETASWPQTGYAQLPALFNLPAALPPGTYDLLIQPLNQDAPLGEPQAVGKLTLGATPQTAVDLPPNRHILFDNGLQLRSWEMPDATVRPGHNLPLNLYWQTTRPFNLAGIRYDLTIIKPDGTELRQQTDLPVAEWLTSWPINTPLMERTGLYFRPETEPGEYELRWQLFDGEQVVPGRPYGRPWSTQTVTLGKVTVVPWPLQTTLPTDITPLDAAFGSAINLAGYTLTTPEPEQLQLSLAWQTQSPPDDNYHLFVHLADDSGTIVAQADRVPGDMLRPTGGWRADEVISDTVLLTVPADVPPGNYQLLVGLYQPESGVRLPITFQGQPQPNDQLVLTTIPLP